MQNLISSFLIQAKNCNLPGVGNFSIVTNPASFDTANKLMLPPAEEIIFTEKTGRLQEGLISYIAMNKGLSDAAAEIQIKEWCQSVKNKFENNETVHFDTVGSLHQTQNGAIIFEKTNHAVYFTPVTANRVVHKNTAHSLLVGDRQTTSTAMNEFLHEEEAEVKISSWKITAIILFAIAIIILFFHFYYQSKTSGAISNQSDFSPASPADTYILK